METKIGTGRLIGGLIVIGLGGLFLLDSLDILDFGEIIGWAVSVALILFGLGLLVTRKFRQLFAPFVLIIVGVLLLLNNLGVDSWRFWPVILILVGGAIIFGGSAADGHETANEMPAVIRPPRVTPRLHRPKAKLTFRAP